MIRDADLYALGFDHTHPDWHVETVQAGSRQAEQANFECKECGAPMYGKSLTYNMMRVVAQSTEHGFMGTAWRGVQTPVRIPVDGQKIIRNMRMGITTLEKGFKQLANLHTEKPITARIDNDWHKGRIVPVAVDEVNTGYAFIDIAFILEDHA